MKWKTKKDKVFKTGGADQFLFCSIAESKTFFQEGAFLWSIPLAQLHTLLLIEELLLLLE